jgi:hypothetical protein
MSTLKVNNLVTKELEDDLAFKTNNTTRMILTSAGTLSGNTTGSIYAPGMVLQVVQAQTSAQITTNTTTYANVVSANITPSSTSSKILVSVAAGGVTYAVGTTLVTDSYAIFRDSTELMEQQQQNYGNHASTQKMVGASLIYLDSPATISEITYSFQAKRNNASYYTYWLEGNKSCSITLQEIAG